MRLDRFPVGGEGYMYMPYSPLSFRDAEDGIVAVRRGCDLTIGIMTQIKEIKKEVKWKSSLMIGNERIFKTMGEAIRFQIRLREFEIYKFKKNWKPLQFGDYRGKHEA